MKQSHLNQLIEIGLFLSVERDLTILKEKILLCAKKLTSADGGTLYTVTPQKKLHFETVTSDSLKLHLGGTSVEPIPYPEIPLFLQDGTENNQLMVTSAINQKKTINIKDAYVEQGFDFSATHLFDEIIGYQTRSVLTTPIKDHEGNVIAALQLINPINPETGESRTFSEEDQKLAESLGSQAGVALSNQLLITNLKKLFESLIRVVAEAIDKQSPAMGNHGKRVPVLVLMLANAVNEMKEGPLKDVLFTKEELYELEAAAFLHDCGKITTPVYLIEKQKKLETIYDRMDAIEARFAFLKMQEERDLLAKKMEILQTRFPLQILDAETQFYLYDEKYKENVDELNDELDFLKRCNEGVEPINEKAKLRIQKIGLKKYGSQNCLTESEKESLSIESGNLTKDERKIMENHVVMTYRMLSELQYPKELQKVPEIAASHHERMDGKGYPRGLRGDEMSLRARILTISDVFEALSAPDRAYKPVMPLSEILEIMQSMVTGGSLDPDLFAVFLEKKVYLKYASQYLTPDQIDVS